MHLCNHARAVALAGAAIALQAVACGDAPQLADPDASTYVDFDGDGFSVDEGDCDDTDRWFNPGAADPCDGFDQNCDGVADELFDNDGDNWTTCSGDCRDNDPMSFPGAVDVQDGIDNDCDGLIDNHSTQFDDDGDGYSEDQGDCNDDLSTGGALINPGALEVQLDANGAPELSDNDCDGLVDEAFVPCQNDLPRDDPRAYAHAMDICHELTRASWSATLPIDPRSRGRFSDFGDTYVPRSGGDFVVLSTGIAGDRTDPGWVAPSSPGTNFGAAFTAPHPDPQGLVGCSQADELRVNDYSEIALTLQVPTNANAFAFDFNFMSSEFPDYVCTDYDDTFLALLDSAAFEGNVSFDAMGNRVSINVGFFDVCAPGQDPSCTSDAELVGTGYAGQEGGGTGWLTTTAPVVPGEKITLTFSVWDEGDHILDSSVILDNFRWELEPVAGPITVPRLVTPRSHAAATLSASSVRRHPQP